MRNLNVFIATALGVYAVFNTFILWRTVVMLERIGWVRWGIVALLLLGALSYPLGHYFDAKGMQPLGRACSWVGAFWIAVMFYLLIAFFGVMLVDCAMWFAGKASEWERLRPVVWSVITGCVAVLVLYGAWNAAHPRVVHLDWAFAKWPAGAPPIKVTVVSDIHVGAIIGGRRTERIVQFINEQKSDLILLVGDTVDSDLSPVVQQDLGDSLRQLRAPLGVYGVTGNHEYIGGIQTSVDYLKAQGVHLLRDEAVLIADSFYLVGREDASIRRFDGASRARLSFIAGPLDRSRSVLVMDHQPLALDEAEQAGVDGHLSGHTHAGQMWPFNYVVQRFFPKLVWGYKKFGHMHAYVSSGVGSWGPPVRIGNRPEIIVITLHGPG